MIATLLLLAALFLWYLFADCDFILLFCDKLLSRSRRKMENFRGKVVWITGASSGIGEYLAYDLAARGAKLILSARRKTELERVREACIAQCGQVEIRVLPLDISKHDTHASVVSEALEFFNHIDILINNAGRSQRALIIDTELEVDRELLETNTLGSISLTKALLPSMVQRKSGHVAVVSSTAGKLGVPVSASYAASKHALHGWFNTLRLELMAENIDVTIVCPGPVVSEGAASAITHVVGESVGSTNVDDSQKMSTARCAHLIVTAIDHQLSEAWIARNPVLFFSYVGQYCPILVSWLAKFVVPGRIAAFKAGHKDINARVSLWQTLGISKKTQ
ncbi:dehydrogenase/reductase SDR family member 7-like [Oscarella lobularis]|uniref:dehydrogenase/reductase SDR family member 7-like n=1 Tax=Oscarella lobularis TaxID=121494 RepID=UPI0033144D60